MSELNQREEDGLGYLLVAAGLITPQMLDETKAQSAVSGHLLGRALLLRQAITAPMLQASLTLLVMRRDGGLTKEEAVKVLRETRRCSCELDEALANCRIKSGIPTGSPKLAQLLSLSKFITEPESAIAVERALQERKMVGEILVNSGSVSDVVLRDALVLQKMVARGALSIGQAAEVLQRAYKENKTIGQMARHMKIFSTQAAGDDKAMALLKQAGMISDEMIAACMLEQEQYQMSACKALLASGRLPPATLSCAVQCVDMIELNALKTEQAVVAIGICERSRVDLNSALSNMGIAMDRPAPMELTSPRLTDKMTIAFADWASFPQFFQTFVLVALVAASDFAVYKFANNYANIALLLSLIVLGAGLMKLGFSWRGHRDQRDDDRVAHITTARQTKARLEKRSR